MTVQELQDACRLYGLMTGFDSTLAQFRASVAPGFDPFVPEQRLYLLKWLNTWACRQFSIKDRPLASASLETWARDWLDRLPGPDRHLTGLTASEVRTCFEAGAGWATLRRLIRTRWSGRGHRRGDLSRVWALEAPPTTMRTTPTSPIETAAQCRLPDRSSPSAAASRAIMIGALAPRRAVSEALVLVSAKTKLIWLSVMPKRLVMLLLFGHVESPGRGLARRRPFPRIDWISLASGVQALT